MTAALGGRTTVGNVIDHRDDLVNARTQIQQRPPWHLHDWPQLEPARHERPRA